MSSKRRAVCRPPPASKSSVIYYTVFLAHIFYNSTVTDMMYDTTQEFFYGL